MVAASSVARFRGLQKPTEQHKTRLESRAYNLAPPTAALRTAVPDDRSQITDNREPTTFTAEVFPAPPVILAA
jgi:hypothetical protein